MKRIAAFIFTICVLASIAFSSHATHLKSGVINALKLEGQNLSWQITLTTYIDGNSPVRNPSATLSFGDGSAKRTIPVSTTTLLPGYNIVMYTYTTTHTYPAPGRYTIFYYEQNRNTGILNIDNSDFSTFYIETELVVDPSLPFTSTPLISNPPLGYGSLNRKFTYNPAARDADGDSLSYRLITPRQYIIPNGPVMQVTNYRSPETLGGALEDGSAPATFTLNPQTGTIEWNSPGIVGEYIVAFEIIKWRWIPSQTRHVQIATIVYDMMVTIRDNVATSLPESETLAKLQLNLYPNPARGHVNISLVLADTGMAQVLIYHSSGQQIAEITNSDLMAGKHNYTYNTEQLKPGLYLCQVKTTREIISKKLVVR